MNKDYPSSKIHEKEYNIFKRNPIIPSVSIYNMISLLSNMYKKTSAIDCIDLNVNYDILIRDSILLSKSFKELGITNKDIVTIQMPSYYQAVISFLALNRIGATTTFINSESKTDEVIRYLNLYESKLFINYNKSIEYNKIIKDKSSVRNIITLNKDEINNYDYINIDKRLDSNIYLTFNNLGNISRYYNKPFNTLYSGKQDALILYTSGSTGIPKSVVLTNENLIASGMYMKNTGNIKPIVGEKCLVCVPFSYPYGFATSLLMSLICGRTAILAPSLNKNNISYYLTKNPNYIFGSPALLELIKRNIPKEQDLSSVHTFVTGGDFLTPSQNLEGVEYFKQHNANTVICNGSGNAESVGTNTMAVGSKIDVTTVGRVLTGSHALVIDPETKKEKKYDEEGVLLLRGKHIFKEYYKEPEKTKEAKIIYNGKEYLNTGNMGKLNRKGYFTLTGRSSRFYIQSDLNKVYLEHIQEVINSLDFVETSAVVKVPDKDLLYTSIAYIVLKDNIDVDKEYILELISKPVYNKITNEILELKPFEVPKKIEFINELPRTIADKVDFRLLEEMALDKEKKLSLM